MCGKILDRRFTFIDLVTALTLPVDLLLSGSVHVRHRVQIEVQKAVESHELGRRPVVRGKARRESVLQDTGAELPCRHQRQHADHNGNEERQKPQSEI